MNALIKDMVPVSNLMELSEEEVNEVSAGLTYLVAAAAIATVMGALNSAEAFGEKLGKALYYATR